MVIRPEASLPEGVRKLYLIFKMASCSMEQHLRNYVVDIQQRLERGRQDAVNFYYILFRIDWLINLLIRYTSEERNAGPNILHRVINLLREVNDMLSHQEFDNNTSYRTEKFSLGCMDGPSLISRGNI